MSPSTPFAHAVHGETPPTRGERVAWLAAPVAFLLAGYLAWKRVHPDRELGDFMKEKYRW